MLVQRKSIPDGVTILAVADQVSEVLYDRFDPSRWRDIDLVLSCGDLPPSYLDFLCSMLDVPVLYVRGNHDDAFKASEYDGCENIHGRIVECKGLRIAGFEGSMWYNGRPFQHTERDMRSIVFRTRLKAFRGGSPDIIVAHAPPAGTHDGTDVCHRGFQAFRSAIDSWRPSLFLHGHMHSYERTGQEATIGTTRVINVFPYTRLTVPISPRTLATSPGDSPGLGAVH